MTKRLGKGLAELIEAVPQSGNNFLMLQTKQISPNRLQPREAFSDSSLEELKASIKRQGVIEPVIVRPLEHGRYELVAGERRLRAAESLGIAEIPAIIKTLSDKEALEYSLIENIQREGLNPIEEARGYARLLEEFGYTQEDIAEAVGKERTTITNMLRLLKLPEEIQKGLRQSSITAGHAKALLAIEEAGRQLVIYRRIVKTQISVRQTEALVVSFSPLRRRRALRLDPQLKAVEDELRRTLGTKVSLFSRKKGGRIVIDYFSDEELGRIVEAIRACSQNAN